MTNSIHDMSTAPRSPDPDNMNDHRAVWASFAIAAFMRITGCDQEDALGDLLADLMHWADRCQYDFALALLRAQDHYEAETAETC